jgi:hypothetical protein
MWLLRLSQSPLKKSRHTEHKKADRKGYGDFGTAPSKLLGERNAKYAPGIDSAQRGLQEDTSDTNIPTICFHNLFSKSIHCAAADSPPFASGDQRPVRNQ